MAGAYLETNDMERPVLVFEKDAARVHVRIWRYEEGRFLLERVEPSGKGTAVFCPSFEKAFELWCQVGVGADATESDTDDSQT